MILGFAFFTFLGLLHLATCADELRTTPGCFPANPNGTAQSIVGGWFILSALGGHESFAQLAIFVTPVANFNVSSHQSFFWNLQGDVGECEREAGDSTANVTSNGRVRWQMNGDWGRVREYTVLHLKDDLLILYNCIRASGDQCSISFVLVGTKKAPLELRDEETIKIAKTVDETMGPYCVNSTHFIPVKHHVEKPNCPGIALSYGDYLAQLTQHLQTRTTPKS